MRSAPRFVIPSPIGRRRREFLAIAAVGYAASETIASIAGTSTRTAAARVAGSGPPSGPRKAATFREARLQAVSSRWRNSLHGLLARTGPVRGTGFHDSI